MPRVSPCWNLTFTGDQSVELPLYSNASGEVIISSDDGHCLTQWSLNGDTENCVESNTTVEYAMSNRLLSVTGPRNASTSVSVPACLVEAPTQWFSEPLVEFRTNLWNFNIPFTPAIVSVWYFATSTPPPLFGNLTFGCNGTWFDRSFVQERGAPWTWNFFDIAVHQHCGLNSPGMLSFSSELEEAVSPDGHLVSGGIQFRNSTASPSPSTLRVDILGLTGGALVLIACAVVAVVCWWRRRAQKPPSAEERTLLSEDATQARFGYSDAADSSEDASLAKLLERISTESEILKVQGMVLTSCPWISYAVEYDHRGEERFRVYFTLIGNEEPRDDKLRLVSCGGLFYAYEKITNKIPLAMVKHDFFSVEEFRQAWKRFVSQVMDNDDFKGKFFIGWSPDCICVDKKEKTLSFVSSVAVKLSPVVHLAAEQYGCQFITDRHTATFNARALLYLLGNVLTHWEQQQVEPGKWDQLLNVGFAKLNALSSVVNFTSDSRPFLSDFSNWANVDTDPSTMVAYSRIYGLERLMARKDSSDRATRAKNIAAYIFLRSIRRMITPWTARRQSNANTAATSITAGTLGFGLFKQPTQVGLCWMYSFAFAAAYQRGFERIGVPLSVSVRLENAIRRQLHTFYCKHSHNPLVFMFDGPCNISEILETPDLYTEFLKSLNAVIPPFDPNVSSGYTSVSVSPRTAEEVNPTPKPNPVSSTSTEKLKADDVISRIPIERIDTLKRGDKIREGDVLSVSTGTGVSHVIAVVYVYETDHEGKKQTHLLCFDHEQCSRWQSLACVVLDEPMYGEVMGVAGDYAHDVDHAFRLISHPLENLRIQNVWRLSTSKSPRTSEREHCRTLADLTALKFARFRSSTHFEGSAMFQYAIRTLGDVHEHQELFGLSEAPKIGSGSEGRVVDGQVGQERFAIKLVPFRSAEERLSVRRQFDAFNKIERSKATCLLLPLFAFQSTDKTLAIVLPRADRSLSEQQYDNIQRCQAAVHMAKAVIQLHQHGVAHGDIKPSNFLIMDTAVDKPLLADFGHAFIEDFKTVSLPRGTPLYAPPEYLRLQSDWAQATVTIADAQRSDVFMLAAAVLEVLCCKREAQGEDIDHWNSLQLLSPQLLVVLERCLDPVNQNRVLAAQNLLDTEQSTPTAANRGSGMESSSSPSALLECLRKELDNFSNPSARISSDGAIVENISSSVLRYDAAPMRDFEAKVRSQQFSHATSRNDRWKWSDLRSKIEETSALRANIVWRLLSIATQIDLSMFVTTDDVVYGMDNQTTIPRRRVQEGSASRVTCALASVLGLRLRDSLHQVRLWHQSLVSANSRALGEKNTLNLTAVSKTEWAALATRLQRKFLQVTRVWSVETVREFLDKGQRLLIGIPACRVLDPTTSVSVVPSEAWQCLTLLGHSLQEGNKRVWRLLDHNVGDNDARFITSRNGTHIGFSPLRKIVEPSNAELLPSNAASRPSLEVFSVVLGPVDSSASH